MPASRLALAGLALAVLPLVACSDSESSTRSETSQNDEQAPCLYATGGEAARDVEPPSPTELLADTSITIATSAGEIAVRLLPEQAPCTVNSFLSLARQGYFDDTPCPRLTLASIFVLQCGDPTGTRTGGPGYTFYSEVTGREKYTAGTLAMANSGTPDSNGSQFFFVYADTELDPSYTVFGEVLNQEGLDVLREVAKAGTADKSPDGTPAKPVSITKVS